MNDRRDRERELLETLGGAWKKAGEIPSSPALTGSIMAAVRSEASPGRRDEELGFALWLRAASASSAFALALVAYLAVTNGGFESSVGIQLVLEPFLLAAIGL